MIAEDCQKSSHCWRPQLLRDAKGVQNVNGSVFNLHKEKKLHSE
jgi:hypothetical protein